MRYKLYGWTHEKFAEYNDDPEDTSKFFMDLENDEQMLIDYAILINESDDYDSLVRQKKAMLDASEVTEDVRTIQIWDDEDEAWLL